MSVLKLQGTAITSDNLAALDVPNDGFLNAILMSVAATGMDAQDDLLRLEVSFMSTNSFSVNDVRGSIAMMQISQQFLTSGGGIGSNNQALSGLKVPVSAGERIHIHTSVSTGVGGVVQVYLYIDDGIDLKTQRRRR